MPQSGSRFRFGSFELDCNSGELRKNGIRIKLEDQPCRLLAALLERQGEVLTRDELKTALWSDHTYVDFDRSLTKAINKVRAAIGDSAANPRFIETLPRRGYRFVAPVSVVDGNGDAETAATAAAPEPLKSRSWRWIASASLALAGVIVIGVWMLAFRTPHNVPGVAVLPLENVSGDPEQSYFGDGMTDQLITALSGLRSLRVVSQKSVMQYKGTSKKLPEIARDLNVDAIVEGSVAQSNGRVRINARLIRFPGEQAVWSKTYERDAADILSLQSELARNIADEIGALVTPEEQQRLAGRARAVDPELHASYLKGRLFANEPRQEMVERGIQMLERVVEKEPAYAPAHAAIAEGWFALSNVHVPPVVGMPKAKAAARKAIELDPDSDAARSVLGQVHLFYDWDWQASEDQFRKALDSNPNSSAAYRGLACLRMAVGRNDEALDSIGRALRLDPTFLFARFCSAYLLANARRYDESIHQAQRTLEWEPGFALMRSMLGMVYIEKGRVKEAIGELEAAVQSQRIPTTLGFLAHGYAVARRKPDAERILGELISLSAKKYVCAFEVATAFASLGQLDTAFTWMDKGIADRADCMVWLRSEPWLQSIRGDARYAGLGRRVGFPQR